MENMVDRALQALVQAWNSHDAGRTALLFTEDCLYENEPAGVVLRGRENLKLYLGTIFAVIPNAKLELKNDFSSGASGVAEFVMSGTPRGTLPGGLPATGKSFSVKMCAISDLEGGLVKRVTHYWDMVGFLTQLGLMPPALG